MLLSTPALLFGLFVMRNKINIPEKNYKYYNRTYTWEWKKVNSSLYVLCKCKCWKETRVRLYSNNILWSKSCIKCSKHQWDYKHWFSHTRFYHIWIWILSRCNNIHHNTYKFYWAKWIKCEWKSFKDFKNDMYESYINHVNIYWEKNTTIDRKDFKWNYNKNNCCRATTKEQQINKSQKTIGNTWMSAKELADKYWYTISTIYTYSSEYKDKLIDYLESKNK